MFEREKLGMAICVLASVSLVRHNAGAVELFEHQVASYAGSSPAGGGTSGARPRKCSKVSALSLAASDFR